MTTYWCERAWTGAGDPVAGLLVDVEGGVFTSLVAGVPSPPAGAVALAGLTIPGMANGHSHAFHRALRGRTHRAPDGAGPGAVDSFWTWRDRMYSVAARLDPDNYHRLARAVFAEMATAGITAVGEFHYVHHAPGGAPYPSPEAMSDALAAAAADAGVRITLLDTCYLHGGLDETGASLSLNDVQRRFSDGSAAAWASRAERTVALAARPGNEHVRAGAAIHSVRAVDPDAIGLVAAWAAERGLPLHAHVSEQLGENRQALAAYGTTPVRLLADRGALSERFTAVHATHLTDDDIGLLGAARCTACFCPTTERDLADGIGPAAALRGAGARLSLGSDSHAVIDLLEEARAVELHERLVSHVRGRHDAASLLAAACAQGHASIGWPEAGRIAVGAPADLVSIRLDSVRTAGTAGTVTSSAPEQVLDAAVFAATAADVHHVVASGRVVVRDGAHTSIDVPAELDIAIAEVTA